MYRPPPPMYLKIISGLLPYEDQRPEKVLTGDTLGCSSTRGSHRLHLGLRPEVSEGLAVRQSSQDPLAAQPVQNSLVGFSLPGSFIEQLLVFSRLDGKRSVLQVVAGPPSAGLLPQLLLCLGCPHVVML